jgi:protease I
MANILIIIPHSRFDDQEFETTYKTLAQGGHSVQIGSTHHTEAKGNFGLLAKPDVNITFVEPDDYDVYIFIGGEGIAEFFTETRIHNLIRNAHQKRKVIAAIGTSIELLVYAGIITGKKVTCHPTNIANVQSCGAYYTGRIVEIDGDIITATDTRAKEEFAATILKSIDYINNRKGLR